MTTPARQLEILHAICNLPTAPYTEQHVIAWLLNWARHQGNAIKTRRDAVGNVYLEYRRGKPAKTPLVIEAHMDHPGFLVTAQKRDGRIDAEFRGGVKPSHFENAGVRFWLNDPPAVKTVAPALPNGRWIKTRVERVQQKKGERILRATLAKVKEKLPLGTLGMWDLPDARIAGKNNQVFAARVCDDLAGVAAIICLLEQLIAQKIDTHLIGLCSRAEEVGFAGVLALCENGWLKKGSPVIGLETSKASANAPQGAGPVIRVGDRTGIFSPGLTHFIAQSAGHIADDDSSFKYQRKLMDGGMCNSTAFLAWGYDSAAMCVALGNYHNMHIRNEPGWKEPAAATTGKGSGGIASETIHTADFLGMVRILVEAARRFRTYTPGFGIVKDRLARMHRDEQKKLLWQTSDLA